jgi:hypothetical protein
MGAGGGGGGAGSEVGSGVGVGVSVGGGGGGGAGSEVGSGVGVGVGVPVGGGGSVLGSEGAGGAVLGSDGGGVSLGVTVPAVVVVPPGGWLGSGVGVSDRVFVGDSASQMDGVGSGAGDEEYGTPGSAAAGTSSAPPATT